MGFNFVSPLLLVLMLSNVCLLNCGHDVLVVEKVKRLQKSDDAWLYY